MRTRVVRVPKIVMISLLIIAGWLGAMPVMAQVHDTLTLDRVVADVLKHNDRIAAARYMQEAAEQRVGIAGAWDDPMLMLGVQNLPTSFDFKMDPMTMKMVGLSQNIPYAGQKGLAKRAARSEVEASAQERRGTEIDLVTAAKSAYLDLHYRRLNLQNLQDQRGLFEQIITSSTGKLRANQAGQDEVLASQADLWRLESSILSAQQQVESSERALNSLRGVDPRASVPELAPPSPEQIPESAEVWVNAAKEHYPPLQRLRRQAESYSLSARSSRRMQWPMLGLSASYGIRSGFDLLMDGTEQKRDNMVNFGANLSLPIFSGRQQRTMARSMDAMQKSTEAEANQLSRDIEAELLNLYSRAQRLQKSVEMYTDRIIPASEDAYQSAQAGYVNNRTSFVTLMTYALAINRDRITANDLANELGRTLVEVTRYITDAGTWESGPQNER